MAREDAQLTIGRRQGNKGRLAFVGAMLGTHNTDVHYALAFIFRRATHVVNRSGIAERLLGKVVALTVDDGGEAAHGVLDANVLARGFR